jgi:dTDP-4-dehydrorhamnose reductase
MGQLGRTVSAQAVERGRSVVGVDIQEMPLDDREAIRAVVLEHRPRFVVHCGAITNVDGCEKDPAAADRVNGDGTAWIAEACAGIDAGMLYVSTDFVFDGQQQGVPYATDAKPNPLSAYGRSKLLGEQGVLRHARPDFYVVRTSWVFGPGGKNFPKAILDRARSGQPLKVVTDQEGRPTMTQDLAAAMLDLAQSGAPAGIYHAANEGQCTWHRFAVDILREAGLGKVPVGTQTAAELDLPAKRPPWSVLDTSRLAAVRKRPLPHYLDALRRYLKAEGI